MRTAGEDFDLFFKKKILIHIQDANSITFQKAMLEISKAADYEDDFSEIMKSRSSNKKSSLSDKQDEKTISSIFTEGINIGF